MCYHTDVALYKLLVLISLLIGPSDISLEFYEVRSVKQRNNYIPAVIWEVSLSKVGGAVML